MQETLQEALKALILVPLPYLLGAIALYTSGLVVLGARWRIFVKALGETSSVRDTTLSNLAGIFVNNVTPASRIGGEICRVTLIRTRSSMSLKAAMASSICDRISDVPVIAMLALATILLLAPSDLALSKLRWLLGVSFLAVALVSLIFVCIPKVRRPVKTWIQIIRDLSISTRAWLGGVGLSILFWAFNLARIALIASAFGVSLSLPKATALALVTIAAGVVPTLGGLGAIEGGLVGCLLFFGVTADTAVAITAMERAVTLLYATGAGGCAFSYLGGRKLWTVIRPRALASNPAIE